MSIASKEIKDIFFSYLNVPLKKIEPELNFLYYLPTKINLLPGLYIEIQKISPASAGIGGFLGYKKTKSGEIQAEIYAKRYNIVANIDTWLKKTDSKAASKICDLSEKTNEYLLDEKGLLREKGVLKLEVGKANPLEIEILSGTTSKTPNVLRKTIKLEIVYETKEIKKYELIKEIVIEQKLG